MFVVSVLQAASPLVHTSDKYQSQQVGNGSHSHIDNNRTISTPIPQHSYHHNYVDIEEDPDFIEIAHHPVHPSYDHHQQYQGSEHGFRMTGNGFFSNNSSGPLMKSKSGSLPGRYSTRGFRDTFISSMNNPTTALSANSSPQHLAVTPPNQNMSEAPTTPTKDQQKDSSGKKWSFGGLFKRKVKGNNSHQLSSSPSVLGNPSPVSVTLSSSSPAPSGAAMGSISTTNNASTSTPVHHGLTRTKYLASRKGKPSESDLSSYDSENETENNYPAGPKRQGNQLQGSQQQSQQPLSFKQNFLTRRLSKRKEKAAKKAAAAENSHNGFLKVPSQLQNGRRVGSSPDSLNNSGGGMNGPWQSWETTKKVPANNYSSSGSLSLSIEGSSKGPRASAKEAVKARAIARRESYFQESSSSDEETGDTEERSRSSLQGSHSSLSSRNRRHRGLNYQASASRRPELIRGSPSSPVVSHNAPSLSEPPVNSQQNKMSAPGSPRWEARIIYQQENLIESDGPVVVKLPKNRALNNSNHSQTNNQQPNQIQQLQNQNQRPSHNQQQNYPHFESPHGNILLSTSTNSDDQQTDSYQYHQQQQQQQGIMPPHFNGVHFDNRTSAFYNNNSHLLANGNGHSADVEISADGVTNGYFEHEIEIQPTAVNFSPRNNNFLAPQSFAHHVGRSPSEPPEIKVQFARDSPHNRMMSPSPYNNNGSGWNSEMNGNSSSPSKYNHHQPVIMSKLGFPVRRLHEVNKLPPTQSPVHMRASEFWRRKEQENVSGGTQSQKRFLSRVRSADSSPLPVPRMRNSPATLLNSNESISSLSSFSAEAPSPNLFSTPKSSKIQSGPLRPQTLVLKTPGFQITTEKDKESSKSKEKVQNQSACERLKVRLPNGQSPSTTPIPLQQQKESQKEQTATPAKNNNKDPSSVKSPGRNLEDALNELEDMYKSLRLSDEDLLDRAERRDLPTAHQELRNAPMLPQSFHFSPPGSVESLATGSSGSNYTHGFHSTENLNRVRAPPLRRSSRPDVENDDMAKRRFEHPEHQPNDPRSIVSKTGSYMVLSPAFSPPSSPCPPTPGTQASVHSLLGLEDPDLTLDDVTFRNYKRANSIRIIEPQPPFGIPIVPVAPAPDSDYLHSKPVEKYRPLFRHVKRPDIVKDDIAFRNLRKDLNQENNLSKDWTPRLFSPTRENVFNYNIKPEQRNKKLRAIRSLSANISHLIPFKESAVNSEIGKWNSFTDLNCEGSPAGSRASSYLQPSWVEQIEKVQTSTETLTENRNVNSNKGRFSAEDRIMAATAGAMKVVTPIVSYDPSKPRRPWTDILLESFEREKQAEIERIAAETAAAADAAEKAALEQKTQIQLAQSSQLQLENSVEEDDDVFEDAREEAKSTSPDDPAKTRSRYATPEIISLTHPSAFQLLAGQKNRRGSWVESKSSSLLSSENDDEEKRRRSWSDVPKDIGAGSAFLFNLNCPPNSPAKKSLFNPLPPPRKIKQINLNAFNTGTKQPILSEGEGEIEAELESLSEIQRNLENGNRVEKTANERATCKNNNAPNIDGGKGTEKQTEKGRRVSPVFPTHTRLTTKRVLSPKSPLSPRSPTRGEDELNELMDALLREADTCGPPTTRRRVRPSSRNKQENNTISQEKETVEESTPIAESVVVPTNNTAMPKGNRIPLPKNPLVESAFEKVVSVAGTCEKTESHITTSTSTSTNAPFPKSTSSSTNENTDNNTPKVGKMPKSDSIEDLIDSINESLPELEASCFKNNNQPNSSNSTTTSECYIVSSTTTSTVPPPLSLDSLKQSQSRENQIMQQRHGEPSLQIQNKDTHIQTSVTVPDENENLEKISLDNSSEKNQHEKSLLTPGKQVSSLDPLDIVDDDFQRPGKDNGSRRESSTTPSTSKSSADAGSLSKSKAEESAFETNERINNGKKDNAEKRMLAKGDENYRGEKQIGKRPVAPAFVSTAAKDAHEKENTGNSHCSESPAEASPSKPILPHMRISTSRSRSHSLIGSVSTSPTNTSENGENKREKDKSYRRKSHLNRAFTEEPVPDDIFSIDIDNNERKRPFSQDGSSLESSNVEDAPRMQKIIQKAPNIPSIFSKSEKQSPNATPASNNATRNQSPITKESPSPKLQNKSTAITNKVQSFEKKGSPVAKRDSFSDAEGVNFIKKFLQKESEKTGEKPIPSSIKTQVSNTKESAFCLKKSPSAGSNSYWSRFSNSQPAFLKRFFDRPEKATVVNENDNSTVLVNNKVGKLPEPKTARSVSVQPKEPEPVMGFSVAQKASFFMKLEHEQRFSKWRKNSEAGLDMSSAGASNSNVRPKSRHLTQPVTPTEVEYASQYFTDNKNGEAKSDIKQVEDLFRNIISSSEHSLMPKENEEMAPLGTQLGISSSYNDCDDSFPFPPENQLDPSNLSLKDRVHMFDKIITTSTKTPSSVAPTPRPPSKIFGNFMPKTNGTLNMLHPTGLPPSSATTYSSTTTTSTTNFLNPQLNHFNEAVFDHGNCFPVIRRRGSTSDVELSSTPKYSPIMPRSFKVKSMFMGGHGHNGDSENFSEDGEVSSGGQEVAEIISKSYENSPIFRKKTWRTQQKQTQASFSKDIWRKCVAQENWSVPQPTFEKPGGNYSATSVLEQITKPTAPSPPATSNLLPILTALSSSNDELNDPKPIPSKIPQSTFSSTSSSTTDIRNKTEVCVKVPHPDDESFQTFFTNDNSNFAFRNIEGAHTNPSQFSNFQTGSMAESGAEGFDRSSGISLEEISSVERQSDLLVMKKNMPVVRRKSSGKSRNPLKALAARIDFRNQKYTEVHIVDDNSVPNENEDQQV